MDAFSGPAGLHLVIGGARSGKSAHAQSLAGAHEAAGRAVCVVATALAADPEMRERIARHRADRPAHWGVVEPPHAPRALAEAIDALAAPGRCLLVDCLTLWLSQAVAPPPGRAPLDPDEETAALLEALARAAGPVLLVGNEIGLGVVPPDPITRRVVDALGHAHQRIAALAGRVTWMVAGLPVAVKGGSVGRAGAAADGMEGQTGTVPRGSAPCETTRCGPALDGTTPFAATPYETTPCETKQCATTRGGPSPDGTAASPAAGERPRPRPPGTRGERP